MPRNARSKSKTGIYHIIFRGVNKKSIFVSDEDNRKFLSTVERYKTLSAMKVYGWCLMGNHAHLLVEEGRDSISHVMKRIAVSYVFYFNEKYETTGHLFQDRFRSESVEDDEYLLTVIRYIHQNPVKAGIVNNPAEWKWSSCSAYYGYKTEQIDMLDSNLILSMFSDKTAEAHAKFKIFNEKISVQNCLEYYPESKLTKNEAKIEISNLLGGVSLEDVRNLPKPQRDELIRKIKTIKGLTQRQAADILGVSQTLISSA